MVLDCRNRFLVSHLTYAMQLSSKSWRHQTIRVTEARPLCSKIHKFLSNSTWRKIECSQRNAERLGVVCGFNFIFPPHSMLPALCSWWETSLWARSRRAICCFWRSKRIRYVSTGSSEELLPEFPLYRARVFLPSSSMSHFARMLHGLPPHRFATWEMTLCLMRNTLTHEYDPSWRTFRELARTALTFFGGRESVERVVSLFEQRVVFSTSITSWGKYVFLFCPFRMIWYGWESKSNNRFVEWSDCDSDSSLVDKFDPQVYGSLGRPLFPRESATVLANSSQPEWHSVWEELFLLLQLIPCRSLNSLLLADEFEHQMNVYSREHDFSDWDHLILYYSCISIVILSNS